MRSSLTALLFASLFSLPSCFAAGPLVLTNIQSSVATGHIALPTQLSHTLPLLDSIANLSTLAAVGTRPRPKDPASFDIEGTDLSLKFSNYGQPLPIPQVLGVLIQALLQAFDNVLAAKRDILLQSDHEFVLRNVLLIAYAGENMTYNVLKSAVAGIVGFMLDYGSFCFSVEILTSSTNTKISELFLTYV